MSERFAALLRRIQGERSQAEFAALVGVRQSTISRYYSGKRQPTQEVWVAIAKAFPEYQAEVASLFFAVGNANGSGPMSKDIAS